MLVYFKKNPEELELKSNRMEKLELYKLKREPKHTTQQHPIDIKKNMHVFYISNYLKVDIGLKMHLSKLNPDSVIIITLF